MKYITVIAILSVLAVAGCTSISNSQGLSVTLQADPSTVFSKSGTILHIDVDNRDQKTLNNVRVELFDTGLLQFIDPLHQSSKCLKSFPRLLPYEFQSLACSLYAPQISEASVQTEVNSRVSFDSDFSATHVFEVMNENEYQRRLASGSYEARPRSYAYGDRNVMINVEFSENPPMVIRPGKKYFVYFTITNAGSGFVNDIKPDDFSVQNDNILDTQNCLPKTVLSPSGRQFPRIACEVIPQPEFLRGRDFRSTDFLINLKYTYELRNSLGISVIR